LDRIEVRGLRFNGLHGALPEELVRPQPFEVDLDLYLDLREAGQSDELATTVDYAQLCQLVKSVIDGPPATLLEHLAEQIAGRCLAFAGRAGTVVVSVRKLRPPVPVEVSSLGVRLRRSTTSRFAPDPAGEQAGSTRAG
jgi:dihydroneopterin aldolase